MKSFLEYILFSSLIIFSFSMIKSQRSVTSNLNRFKRSISTNANLKTDYNDFLTLLKPILIERVSGTPGNEKVRNYLKQKMEDYGWVVEENKFIDNTPIGPKNFANIIANLPIGQNFQSNNLKDYKKTKDFTDFHTNNRVVFACHYDSKLENYEFVGAIDSAVPCAIMLDMAKFLKDNFDNKQFKRLSRHLQFIFFDGEEAFKEWNDQDSIYGARHHAKTLMNNYNQQSFDSIDLFVLLDLIGGNISQFPNYFTATSNTYRLLAKIEASLIKQGLLNQNKMYYFASKGVMGYGGVQDDHLPFLAKNVPVLHLIPVPFPDQWHTRHDNYENLNHNRIQDLRLILKTFLGQILNNSKRQLDLDDEL